MSDELDAPLGDKKQNTKKKNTSNVARKGWRSLVQFNSKKLPLTRLMLGGLFALIAIIAAIIVLIDNPDGGRPSASAAISNAPLNNQVATNIRTNENPITIETNATRISPTQQTTQISNSGTSISIISVDDNLASGESVTSIGISTLNDFGVYVEMTEETSNGAIPRISSNGNTPFNAYARASLTPQTANGKKLIAIIVTGMGLSETGTLDAINKLPDAVTLAFAPYGRSLNTTTKAARNGGHEILLSLPLEPFDYPQNDPGPQTLLSDQPPRANLDRLFWLMGRFGGYIGVINHMGAKFTSSAKDFNPIMEELAIRGLGYVDDGTSKRSLAANLAGNNKVPFAIGSEQLDINPSRASILAALNKLEQQAANGKIAIGIASALPISIKTISEYSKTLKEKNIILVPVSALMNNP